MNIQSYQIHNVLNVYRQTLTQNHTDRPRRSLLQQQPPDTDSVSKNDKNQFIMDKVAANVIKKVTNINPATDFGREVIQQVQKAEKDHQRPQQEKQFVFNTMEGNNLVATRSIAIDNSQMLMRRLDELARSAVNPKNK
jgi:hypothetical protein